MPANTTTLTSIIKPVVLDMPTVGKFSNKHYVAALQALGMKEAQAEGDTALQWRFLRSGNTSAGTYTEAQAVPASGNQVWSAPSLTYDNFWVRAQVSGIAADALGSRYLEEGWSGAAAGYGEIRGALDDLIDVVNTTFMGSTGAGIQLAIDSAGTYAGLNRATITEFASVETAGGAGALTAVMMNDTAESIMDNDRGGRIDGSLMPVNQAFNYKSIAGVENATAANRLVRYTVDVAGGTPKFDYGMVPGAGTDTGLEFMGKPIHAIPDMNDNEVYILANVAESWISAIIRPIKQENLAKTDDSAIDMLITHRLTVAVLNPRIQGKVSDLAA